MAKPDGMKARREMLGFTQEATAQAIGVALSSYKCWEQGIRTPRVGFRPKIARVLRASVVEVGLWFDDTAPPPEGMAVPAWLGHFAALEQGAAELWAYHPVSVPGLLQTAAYAAAVQRDEIVPPSDDEVDRWVSHRLARQEVLRREPDPLALSVVLDESVLYRVAGDGEIMAEQLDHLAGAAERSNIDVRILPLDRGTHVAAFGAFTLMTSPGASEPYMAIVFDRSSAHYLELASVVAAHARLFTHLQDVSRSPSASIDLIRTVVKERYS